MRNSCNADSTGVSRSAAVCSPRGYPSAPTARAPHLALEHRALLHRARSCSKTRPAEGELGVPAHCIYAPKPVACSRMHGACSALSGGSSLPPSAVRAPASTGPSPPGCVRVPGRGHWALAMAQALATTARGFVALACCGCRAQAHSQCAPAPLGPCPGRGWAHAHGPSPRSCAPEAHAAGQSHWQSRGVHRSSHA